MMKPKAISAVETEETKVISRTAFLALNDKKLSDEQADAIITECNAKLTALGIPSGGLTVSRAAYRKAFPNFGI